MKNDTSLESVTNGGGSIMTPLELEEETMSLFQETNGRATVLRKRRPGGGGSSRSSSSSTTAGAMMANTFHGLLRSRTAFAVRNAVLLAALAWMVFFFVDAMNHTMEYLPMDDENPRGIHQSSFGGKNNPASIAGQRAHAMHEEEELHNLKTIPLLDNAGQVVPSVSKENDMNHIGHYWHDPYTSVFASPLYDGVTQEQLGVAQQEFLEKSNETAHKFGTWNLVDPYFEQNAEFRPKPRYENCHPNRDCNITTDFPADAWQMDAEYVSNFIGEAKKLIVRVKEAIYEEYGHSSFDKKGNLKPEEQREERSKIFQVITTPKTNVNEENVATDKDSDEPLLGIAHLSPAAWEALVRKLLHALMTNNDFFVVVAGDGTAAGHGNNFLQSPLLQMHYLMEPVMDFLGIRLISRNMATKDTSVLFGAMGGGDFYGEMDLLWYDSHADTKGAKDLLYKQSILSGERVPVILTSDPVNIEKEASAWVGNLQPNTQICGSGTKMRVCDMDVHNSVCWVPHVPITPPQPQDENVGEAEFYPGVYAHQLQARKLSMLLLHALDAALDQWEAGVEADGFPLADSYWHVGPSYHAAREAVRNDSKKGSACEATMGELAMLCHVELHGHTEWTPRVTPYANSLRAVLTMDAGMNVAHYYTEELYMGIDLLPRSWAIPKGEVDPHLVAIGTSAPPPDDCGDEESNNFAAYDDDFGLLEEPDGGPDKIPDSTGDNGNTRRRRQLTDDQSTAASTNPRFRKVKADDDGDPTTDLDTVLSPGKGWTMYGAPAGFCDGSSQSWCGRSEQSTCLLAGHNDYTGAVGLLGDGLSGWLLMEIKHVQEGILLARIDMMSITENPVTEGWTEIDGGEEEGTRRRSLDSKTETTTLAQEERNLGGHLAKDFIFDYSINGEVTSLTKKEFEEFGVTLADGMTVYPLYVDTDLTTDRTVQVGMRIRSEGHARATTMLLTHLYYA